MRSPTKRRRLGPFASLGDVWKRAHIWLSLVLEYPALVSVYKQHRADGFFDFGSKPQRFRDLGAHDATARLLAMRRAPPASARGEEPSAFGSTLRFKSDGAVLPTYLPVEEGASAAIGAVALAAADLYELRTGRSQEVVVSQTGAGLMTATYLYLYAQPSGEWAGCHGFDQTMAAEGTVKPHRKAYECGDGRHIFLHGGFPKLKKGLTDFLGCECKVDAMAAKVAEWEVDKLEMAMQAKGLCATKCRTPIEWRESPQGKVVLGLKELEFKRRRGGGGGRALPDRAARPLSDVIVVDFSHVIASPVVGRTLADHGATVIKVVSQDRPRRELFDAETNHGKRTLTVELDTPEGRARLWDLLRVADVVIDGYTKGVLGRWTQCSPTCPIASSTHRISPSQHLPISPPHRVTSISPPHRITSPSRHLPIASLPSHHFPISSPRSDLVSAPSGSSPATPTSST